MSSSLTPESICKSMEALCYDGSQSNGYFLLSDANGQTTWVDPLSSSIAASWREIGTAIHPANPDADNVVIGGTDLNNASISLFANGGAVFNEQANAQDFRIITDTNSNTLFIDATNDRIAILNSNPSSELDITGIIKATIYNGDSANLNLITTNGLNVTTAIANNINQDSINVPQLVNGNTINGTTANLATLLGAQVNATSIHAALINADTLNGGDINFTTLNPINIFTGLVNADTLNGNAFNITHVSSPTLQAIFANADALNGSSAN